MSAHSHVAKQILGGNRQYPTISSVTGKRTPLMTVLFTFFGLLISCSLVGIVYTYKLNNQTVSMESDIYFFQLMKKYQKNTRSVSSKTIYLSPTPAILLDK